MKVTDSFDRPTVKVYGTQGCANEDIFKNIFYGIEEEGIPYEFIPSDTKDAVAMAYKASRESRLGVGVGFSDKEIALHYEKLNADTPLFKIPTKAPAATIRALGTNAARLVKKLPFKEIIVS